MSGAGMLNSRHDGVINQSELLVMVLWWNLFSSNLSASCIFLSSVNILLEKS